MWDSRVWRVDGYLSVSIVAHCLTSQKIQSGGMENLYLWSLTPQEFFLHVMAGREGLIDATVEAAEIRYIQCRLVNVLEDVMMCYG